jgi:hypothetical protein
MVPILVDADACKFELPYRPRLSHRVSLLLIISLTPRLIRTWPSNMNRQLRSLDPDFCLEDGCGTVNFGPPSRRLAHYGAKILAPHS